MRTAAYLLYGCSAVLALFAVWKSRGVDGGGAEQRFWRDTIGPMTWIAMSIVSGTLGNFCALAIPT